ncbi:cytokinin hydroxylase [Andrographis paniculata]|uniref:cytokinin hydroxylase n=1 Tax=Andrographis paniculata TaxID=175694 RepID=UPI0021E8C14D|nr:cytokinin hydroxylase [Andrographis paniculata]
MAAVMAAVAAAAVVVRVVLSWWIWPYFVSKRLKSNGFSGPTPTFPLGNLQQMKKKKKTTTMADQQDSATSSPKFNDIHSIAFPYFSKWQKLYGKVFVYWMGTEAFVYVADAEFLKEMCGGIQGKSWGKPKVFKNDREPMFGNGLVMVEGQDWLRHRHLITPAFTHPNLKAMSSLMVDSVTNMMDKWAALINSGGGGAAEIDVEAEIVATAGEIIARTSFGAGDEKGKKVIEKLREMQTTLFKSARHVGVPFGNFFNSKEYLKSKLLGREIDALLRSIIAARLAVPPREKDLLGLLMAEDGKKRRLTAKELVDECKTFFFAGHETTALLLTWTLLMLAVHREWQDQLREEVREVGGGGGGGVDATRLVGLKKMGWVMNEVLRLYSPAPNIQRQTRHEIRVGGRVIPNGTNIWIDVVSMHHDEALWGGDVNEFKPERFDGDIYGGCGHKMGYLPFGFGGRMCVGRNLSMMEYKIVLTMILTRFSFSLSPKYTHSPSIMLSLRPMHGLPLIFKPL